MGPSFTNIVQDPAVRKLVQDGIIARKFFDGLFPSLLYINEFEGNDETFGDQEGDTKIFTGKGLIKPSTRPRKPGEDLRLRQLNYEQWLVSIQKHGEAIDSDMPTSTTAAASLFLSNGHSIGLQAGQSMNLLARNALFNAALAGHTVADGAVNNGTTLRVKRLNGFTTARRPDLAAGSPVQYASVSATNPLQITIKNGGGDIAANVIGFSPDLPGDEIGPGTLTLSAAVTCSDRDPVVAIDRTYLVRSGGGYSIDSIGSNDLLKLSDVRTMIAHMRDNNVPNFPDGYFHGHIDSTGESQIQSDTEWRTLFTALPNDFRFAQFAVGRAAGVTFLRNSQSPRPDTVDGGSSATYSEDDNFGGEVYAGGTTGGVKVRRCLIVGYGAMQRWTKDSGGEVTEAGITGKRATWNIDNNGITINTDRIDMVIRAPLDRAQEVVSTGWKWMGGFVVRPDGATGDACRFKRTGTIEFGEA